MLKVLGFTPSTQKQNLGVVPTIPAFLRWKQILSYTEFQASLGYMRICPRKVEARLPWVPGDSDAQL